MAASTRRAREGGKYMRKLGTGVALAVALLIGGAAHATDYMQDGLKLIIKGNTTTNKYKTVYVSKTPAAVLPASSPLTVGASFEVLNLNGSCEDGSFDLPAGNWTTNPAATLYKFINKDAPGGPSAVKVALVKGGKVIKVVAKAEPYPFTAATQGKLGTALTIGGDRYCSVFGSPLKDEPHKFIAKGAAAPTSCWDGVCCVPPAPSKFVFTTTVGVGNTGLVSSVGGALLNLVSEGLYLGGGNSGVPWPAIIPDLGVSEHNANCSGTVVSLSGTTAGETGSNRTCTTPACLFDAPLPIPNAATPLLSTCIINKVAQPAAGTLVAATGQVSFDLPLKSEVNLFGDLWGGKCNGGVNAGKPCGLLLSVSQCPGSFCNIATPNVCVGGANEGTVCTLDSQCPDGICSIGIQNCPVCAPDSASGTGSTCRGGLNNGLPCTPGSTDIGGTGDSFPVSHDCPPATGSLLAVLDVPFALTTGGASKTSSVGQFCGYCKDDDASNQGATVAGWGVCNLGPQAGKTCDDHTGCPGGQCGGALPCTSDADCASDVASREKCMQRNPGAFGKSAAVTITETGTPSANLNDFAPHAGTLVSVFCVPPTFDPNVQSSTDLPGPGAVARRPFVLLAERRLPRLGRPAGQPANQGARPAEGRAPSFRGPGRQRPGPRLFRARV
jgi:hypothetical protein